jgi:sugar/nucleoside kinase (ribokinase family)
MTWIEKEILTARKTIYVSDLSGKELDEKDAATVTIRYADARKGQVVLDVNANEVEDLAAKGTKQARRGRRPKTQ